MEGMSATFSVSSASPILNRPSKLSSLSFSSKSFISPMRTLNRAALSHRFPKIMEFSSNDIKVGSNIEVDGAPWRVIGATLIFCLFFYWVVEFNQKEFLHVKPGNGAAFVRTKVRNYLPGNTVVKTFRAGSTMSEAAIYKETKQFTYKDGPQFVFMDLTTFEETRVNESQIGAEKTKWLKEGMDCNLILWNDRLFDVEIPITVKLTVVDVDPGLIKVVERSQLLLTLVLLSLSHCL